MRNIYSLFLVAILLLPVSLLAGGNVFAATTGINISPATPDGNNGYYKNQPTFTISSGPRVGDGGDIWKIDNGDWSIWSSDCPGGNRLYIGPPKPLPIGNHTVYFANSKCSSMSNPNGTIFSETVKYDPDSPTITFSSPNNNSTVNISSITIKGTVSDPTSPIKTLTINGAGAGFSGGNFSKQVNLNPGLNRIVGVVYDTAGNSTPEELFITYVPVQQTSSDGYSSSAPDETTDLGQTLSETVDSVKDILTEGNTDEATSSATPSAKENNNQTEDAKVESAFFNNNTLLALFILVILSSFGVIAFKTEAVSKFLKAKLRK